MGRCNDKLLRKLNMRGDLVARASILRSVDLGSISVSSDTEHFKYTLSTAFLRDAQREKDRTREKVGKSTCCAVV